ncbi:protein-L-isoaspartate(D-aspartate) O-methyltransferase [Minwuia thermotolerans]|uniref:Protein-L-isoaspartate O-methyltransferase n=1 Tax=Minwuia thermotolerans TaxID=2056226 RepID=A0A2M9FVD7_9PROT|nr:protein-L-isoaspartate(D-aspartate) O-methyltransferase [Minwuia thermotolerans]PJK27438.1 protein-L-isoaspartate O-methyltransferase [Minwuia thermotolerans]
MNGAIETMVERQIAARGVRDEQVLRAFHAVPRQMFVSEEMTEFAYEDSPLPIGEEQTISQPFIVALMTEALGLEGGERVLEVGTGSGYAAAILAEIAGEVVTIERFESLAETARLRLAEAGYDNVTVIAGDGTKGHAARAPYDAIVVAAGGPDVPQSLRRQLKVGGRLVIPVGGAMDVQRLKRITRTGEDGYEEEDLGGVRFVPLVGSEGWDPSPGPPQDGRSITRVIGDEAEPIDDIDSVRLDGLLDRIGDARVVLIGEASHGTSEFYRMRARITRELIEKKGFSFVAAEADWPDAARIDDWVRHRERAADWTAFARFPTWMWRNAETREFVDWLRARNADRPETDRAGFYGLDLYSMYGSIDAVLRYLDETDPAAARVARNRYGCLTPWQHEPQAYGLAAASQSFEGCRDEAAKMLRDLLERRIEDGLTEESALFDAQQNARLIANAEAYYRGMYAGPDKSWNQRDSHMFETLEQLLDFHGPGARAVIWAHNSHVGDASATEMSARGEYNIGELCRDAYGLGAFSIGFGTHSGTVAAADDWGEAMQVMDVRPGREDSYEGLFHAAGPEAFLLPLRYGGETLREQLGEARLQRAIGVIYRPRTERASHYFQAILPAQFDEYIWFGTTRAVRPLETKELEGVPETYPFGV